MQGCSQGGFVENFCEMGPNGYGPNGEFLAHENCGGNFQGPSSRTTSGVVAIQRYEHDTYPSMGWTNIPAGGTLNQGNPNDGIDYIGVANVLNFSYSQGSALCCCVDYMPGSVVNNGIAWGCLEDEVEDCYSASGGYGGCEGGVCDGGARHGLPCTNETECPGNCHSKAWLYEAACDTGDDCGAGCIYYGTPNNYDYGQVNNDMTYSSTRYYNGDVIFNAGDSIIPQPVDNRCCGSFMNGTPEWAACGC